MIIIKQIITENSEILFIVLSLSLSLFCSYIPFSILWFFLPVFALVFASIQSQWNFFNYFHCQILSQAFKVMNLWLVPWGFHKSFWQGHLDHYKTLSTILNVALSRSLNQCGSPIPEKALGLPTIELRFQLLLQKIKIHSFPLSKQERVTQMFRIKTDTFAPEEVSYTICHSPTSIFWDKHDRLIQNYGLALPLEVFPHSLC